MAILTADLRAQDTPISCLDGAGNFILAVLVPEAKWVVALDVVRRKPDTLAQTFITLHEFTKGKTLFALVRMSSMNSSMTTT